MPFKFIQIVLLVLATLQSACLSEFLWHNDFCDSKDITCNPAAFFLLAQVPPSVGPVTSLYSGAPNWNDYISRDGATPFSASGAACAIVGDGYGTCLHAGVMKTALLTGATSCNDFTLSDNLNALQWFCDTSSGSMRAVSTGLRPGVPLSTLIDFDTGAFRPLQIIATSVGPVPLSVGGATAVLWNNPVVIDNDGLGPGSATAGTVYLVTQNSNALYTLDAPNIALVMRPGLTMAGTAAAAETIIIIAGANHVWLEASVLLTGDNVALRMNGTAFSVARNFRVQTCTTVGSMIAITGNSRSNYLSDLRLSDAGNCVGLQIETNSVFNTYERVTIAGSASNQIRLQAGSTRNTFLDLTAFTAGANNIGNIIVSDTAVLNATLAASGSRGITGTGASDRMLLHNVASMTHVFSGFDVQTPNDNTFVNLAASHNAQNGVIIQGNNNQFRGLLKLGNNAVRDCNVPGGVNPGLIDVTCTDSGLDGSSTYTGQNSSAALTRNVSLGPAFVGPVVFDDVSNPSDSAGSRIFSSITDFLNFDNRYRGWSIDAVSVTNSGLQTACSGASTCRIWDWSLSSSDTILREVNPILTSGATATHMFAGPVTVTFLTFAVEILDDGFGDEDGFCESSERCLYSPNVGAYQGHGDPVLVGTISVDVVTNVTLYRYPFNGR